MPDILQFIMKHWLLCAALIVCIILILIEEIRAKGRGGPQLSATQAIHLINRDQAVVLDVREPNAFKEGHIIDAINISQTDLERNINKLNKHKQRPIIVVCPNGMKSAQVATTLRKQGFDKASVLAGGLMSWRNANLPLAKD